MITKLLKPRSLAVVGASTKETSFGGQLFRSIRQENGLTVYPINPRATEIDGVVAYPDLASLAVKPDCALLAVGDTSIVEAMERVAEAGIESAVIFGRSVGVDNDGRKRTDRLTEIARGAKISVCGGNCMGYINFVDRIQATSAPFSPFAAAGNVGLISHSGSSWSGLIGNGGGLGFNYAISAGQELTVSAADYLQFLIDQEDTRAVACVMESVRDPERFLAALEVADSRDIPVIVLKLGLSEASKHFALSHSGALSGSNAAYDAIFSRYNVVTVQSLDELVDVASLLSTSRKPAARTVAVATDSGGERQLITDLAEQVDLPFAQLTPDTHQALIAVLDDDIEPSNPLDYWGDGNDVIAPCLKALANDRNVGIIVLASNMIRGRAFTTTCADAALEAYQSTEKPVVVMGNVATGISPEQSLRLRQAGVPVLMGTPQGVRSLKRFLDYHFRIRVADKSRTVGQPAVVEKWRERLSSGSNASRSSAEGFELFSDFGLSVSAWSLVHQAADVSGFAAANGFPVVLKIDDPDMPHKTEHGGVILNICDDEGANAAFDALRQRHPHAKIMVQAQSSGLEMLLGMTSDPQFGPIVTFGLGGIFVEILKDVVSMVPPFSAEEVLARLRSLRGAALFEGARGKPKADIAAAAAEIAAFGDMCLALGPQLNEIEINPVLVGQNRVIAVDCLLVTK